MVQKYVEKILFNRWVAFFHDLLWVPVAIVTAYWFRFDFHEIPGYYLDGFCHVIWLALPVYGVSFFTFGLYRGIWRFASIPDL
ncbi:hypothetical protein [Desulfobacter curvatus]|uniref:hypothetical protein n=1 Tax=Desulfobacter curvatus TaxID=2290 RepID=UPI00037F159F|nr:hypothetical protein [Desulfobacter curvatus]